MKKIAIFLFWVSLSFGVLGWLALTGLSADCYFSSKADQSDATRCYAIALTLSSLLFFTAVALSAIAYLWLPFKKQRLTVFIVILPGVFLLTHLF
ncbi:hypothetical protein IB229_19525 [Pseudomonas sp. PDM14]|uniref:hypothetical protein n=1 Tax=Pseudomonas sp. PDM14 TaxID=2769288 RepID=UPI00177A9194|nr:hypothetical protein [Pseudomonas sp. PDM14]MBD9485179.1 hypothetical protein [Pseudomonas sp. PDM14]